LIFWPTPYWADWGIGADRSSAGWHSKPSRSGCAISTNIPAR
jgi:hypothetical protein